MNRYLNIRPLAIQVNRFFRHPNKRQFSSQDQHNPVKPLDAFHSINIKSVPSEAMYIIKFFLEKRKKNEFKNNSLYLVNNSATYHIKWALSSFVEIECDLCINTHAKIVVHVQFTMR